ncbi:MAG: hypothetical protein V2A73_02940 [Pseudomonadota bacterium]
MTLTPEQRAEARQMADQYNALFVALAQFKRQTGNVHLALFDSGALAVIGPLLRAIAETESET